MNRIRELRQVDVANATGIDQKTLSNYETGKTNPDSFAIIALAKFFGVTTDYLLGVSDRNFKDTKTIIKYIDNIRDELSEIKKHLNLF